jgi:uncharacterized protein (DUF2252 family)
MRGRPWERLPERLDPAERVAIGKMARDQVPRASHAGFEPASGRPDPIALLASQARSRVAELIPVRYGRMLASPFAYYRGAALPMAADLATTPVSGLCVQACGDAHLSNFGLFASPERKLVFDVNDFDETLPGPWEWDVKRLAASLEVAARDNGFAAKDRRQIVTGAVRQYRESMRTFAAMSNLDVWYAQAEVDDLLREYGGQMRGRQRRGIEKLAAKAVTRDTMSALSKLTTHVDGRLRFVAEPPLVVPLADLLHERHLTEQLEMQLRGLLVSYRRTLTSDRAAMLEQYEFLDIARKVVGVGSVGTRCWIILMLGRDPGDLLCLQAKEAQPSVLSGYLGRSRYGHQGHRVVAGQRLMQAASDIFLGWERAAGIDGKSRDFYLRQLRDWKLSLPIEQMIPRGMRIYGALCGQTLARAHARSGDRIAIAAYLGASDVFDRAIADFASAYADQNERDFHALEQAATSGRVMAERGV